MKKLTAILLCLLLLVTLSANVCAEAYIPEPIVDNAGLLTSAEESLLRSKAIALYEEYGIWVAILTVNSLDGYDVQSYADDYYDQNYYDFTSDGVLLLIGMDDREWAISTCGNGIEYLSDWDLDDLSVAMLPDLSENRYYEAFTAYLDTLPVCLADAIDGPVDYVWIIQFSLVIGAIVGGIAIFVMRGQMNTAVAQSGAGSYLSPGSFRLNRRTDLYLYSTVNKTRKAQSSSTHRSSGGISHGGRSGRF